MNLLQHHSCESMRSISLGPSQVRYMILTYAMGHSVNTPCPNLKKLMVPASTAATTTIFFPVLSDGNGLVGLAGVFAVSFVCGSGQIQANELLKDHGWIAGP